MSSEDPTTTPLFRALDRCIRDGYSYNSYTEAGGERVEIEALAPLVGPVSFNVAFPAGDLMREVDAAGWECVESRNSATRLFQRKESAATVFPFTTEETRSVDIGDWHIVGTRGDRTVIEVPTDLEDPAEIRALMELCAWVLEVADE